MNNSILKLTTLAGAIGIGILVVLQVQQGMMQPAAQADSQAHLHGMTPAPHSLLLPVTPSPNKQVPDRQASGNKGQQEGQQNNRRVAKQAPISSRPVSPSSVSTDRVSDTPGIDFRVGHNRNPFDATAPPEEPAKETEEPVILAQNNPFEVEQIAEESPFEDAEPLEPETGTEVPFNRTRQVTAKTAPPLEGQPAPESSPREQPKPEPTQNDGFPWDTVENEPAPPATQPGDRQQTPELTENEYNKRRVVQRQPDYTFDQPKSPTGPAAEVQNAVGNPEPEVIRPTAGSFTDDEPPFGADEPANTKESPFNTPPEAAPTRRPLPSVDPAEERLNALDRQSPTTPAEEASPFESKTPRPGNPFPETDAAPLRTTPTQQDLQGDATVGRNVPRGTGKPELKIEKIAPKNAVLGKPLIYHIVITNVGDSAADEVVVEDRIPKGTKLTGTIPRAELINKRLVWRLGTLPPTGSKKISIRVIPQEAGEIGSVATVNFVAEVTASTNVTAPKLSINLKADTAVHLGDPVTLNFQLTNSGTAPAKNVVIQTDLPKGLKHEAGPELQYAVGTLEAGKSETISLQVTAAESGVVTASATVAADGGYSNKSDARVQVMSSRLSLSRTGPKKRYLGRPGIFENVITNTSADPVKGARLVEWLPQDVKFLEASAQGQYDRQKHLVVWNLPAIAPNAVAKVQLKVEAEKPGKFTSQVKVYEANGTHSEAVSQTEFIGFASLGVDMTETAQPIGVGERFSFRVTAKNRGTIAAQNVKLTLTVTPELELISVKGPVKHTQTGNQVQFETVSDLNANSNFDLVLRAKTPGDARVKVSITADQLQQPITKEEAILVVPEPR